MRETLRGAEGRIGKGIMAIDGQKLILAGTILSISAGLWFIGGFIAPIIAAVVIAYVMDSATLKLRDLGLSPSIIATILTIGFMGGLGAALFMAAPLLVSQTAAFAQSLPGLAAELQAYLIELARMHPEFISENEIKSVGADLSRWMISAGQNMVMHSVELLPTLANVVMWMLVVPLMLFFMIKDRDVMLAWGRSFLPDQRRLTEKVWRDLSLRFGGYVRGKIYEIFIVSCAAYAIFMVLEIEFAALLAVIAGLSVLVPYFGAPVAGIPVALVAYSQWGLSEEFAWAIAAYTILQIIDGTILATVLLASTVQIHPVAVMAAVLIAGQMFGFVGLIFAIPMASAVEVLIEAWRHKQQTAAGQENSPEHNTMEGLDRGASSMAAE